VKNISVINEWRCFNLLLVSLDLLISRLRKLSTKTTETYWPETSNLFAVPKETEDLSSSDATDTEGGSDDTNEDVAN
jgi:predicted P-loop ATPase/GTPase